MTDIHDAWQRLLAGLQWLDDQPDQHQRALGIRKQVAAYLDGCSDTIAGRTTICPRHQGQMAHNCGPCRGEAIGRLDDGGGLTTIAAPSVARPSRFTRPGQAMAELDRVIADLNPPATEEP